MLTTETFNTLVANFIELFIISAPWLLLGLVLAGMIKVFIPADFMSRHLGKEGVWTTIKAALFGAPLPLCSCGVIPAALGLRRSGASKSATTAFLVSTPETGIDSVSVSYALLGPFMAVIRPIAAVSSGIVAGLLVGSDSDSRQPESKPSNNKAASSCCSSKAEPVAEPKASCCSSKAEPVAESKASCCSSKAEPVTEPKSSCCSSKAEPVAEPKASCCSSKAEPVAEPKSSCCSSKAEPVAEPKSSCCSSKAEPVAEPKASCCSTEKKAKPEQTETILQKLGQGLNYAATDLLKDTTIWLMVGLFFAALIQTLVSPDYLAQYGQGIFAMVLMILISIPMYICATSSTPIAAGLLLSGVSPGAVLVFMLAGPATNIATLGVVKNELGNRAVVAYLIGVMGTAILFGILTDWLVDSYGFVAHPQIHQHHEMMPETLSYIFAAVLALLMLNSTKNIVRQRFAH